MKTHIRDRVEKKTIHPNSRKAKKINRTIIRDKKIAKKKTLLVTKLVEKGHKFLWFKENLVDGKDFYSTQEVVELIERYTNRFAEELDAIHSEDAARGRRSNPAREETINAILLQEASEFSAGFEAPDIRKPAVVKALREWKGEIRLIQSIEPFMFTRAMAAQ